MYIYTIYIPALIEPSLTKADRVYAVVLFVIPVHVYPGFPEAGYIQIPENILETSQIKTEDFDLILRCNLDNTTR